MAPSRFVRLPIENQAARDNAFGSIGKIVRSISSRYSGSRHFKLDSGLIYQRTGNGLL